MLVKTRETEIEIERERKIHAVSDARIKGSSEPCLTFAPLKHTQPILIKFLTGKRNKKNLKNKMDGIKLK